VAVRAYDGTVMGPADAPATIVVNEPAALARIVAGRGRELALARAYVAGEIDIEGDIFALLALRDAIAPHRPDLATAKMLAETLRGGSLKELKPPPPPPEEVKLHGRRHTRARDAGAITAHYDVSDDFYGLVLGPSMVYSCAVFEHDDDTLEQAQFNKLDLICRKLGLSEGRRLLDIGCGWGSLVLHAAEHYGVRAVGVTISRHQLELARKRVADRGLTDRVEVRYQDYRDIADGPFDAISSVGMFEHVGLARTGQYMATAASLLAPGGRFLNHAITRPAGEKERIDPDGFINRYVFPDGELLEVGKIVSAVQAAGLEVRHVESLREHYATTLRRWVDNLQANWDDAVAEVGPARARIWRLYMAATSVGFESGATSIHQVLAVKPLPGGVSRFPSRPDW
jgi:cyclopropane-fatty-acyl-phospholipid synthase